MPASSTCPKCGTEIPVSEPLGLCARCLLAAGTEASAVGAADAALDQTLAVTGGQVIDTQITFRFVGDYELLEELARGGMGVVFKARQVSLKRTVALKMIHGGSLAWPQAVQRFQTEAEAAATLDHPHIVPIYEIGQHEGHHYFTMKLLSGGSLSDALREHEKAQLKFRRPARTRDDQHAIARFVGTVAQAVYYAHQRGVLHRDIKPGNILLDGQSEPHVTDFGLAKLLEQESGLTLTEAVLGSPGYMAPEQAAGKSREVTTAADIYSLGVVLFELLTGQLPFRGETPLETMRAIVDKEPPHPRTLNPALHADLETICLKCLEKEPPRRYPTAQALVDDLDRFVRDELIQARPVKVTERAWRWCRRNPKLASFAAATAVLLLAVAIGAPIAAFRINQARQAEAAERHSAQRLLYAADMRLAQQAWEEGNLSLMGRLLEAHHPKPGVADARGFEYFYLQNLAKGEQEQVLDVYTNAALGVTISPDGKWLASRTETEVRLWDLTSRTQAWALLMSVTSGADNSFWDDSISFSHDSQYLSIGAEPGLQLFHIPTRQTRILWTNRVATAAFSPVTNLVAFNSTGWGGKARVWDYAINKEVSTPGVDSVRCWSPDGTRLLTARGNGPLDSWDTATWTIRQTYFPQAWVTVAAVSPEGHWVAAADWQGMVHLVETTDGKEIGHLRSGDLQGLALAFSQDGKLLATAGPSQAIQIWDVATRQLVRRLRGHKGKVTGIAFTPNGRTLASSAKDGDVMLWDLARPTGEPQVVNWRGFPDLNPPQFSLDGKWLGLQTNRTSSRSIASGPSGLILDSSRLQASASFTGEIVSFSPDAGQFATLFSSSSPELRVWAAGASSNRATIHLDAPTVSGPGPHSPHNSSTFRPQLSLDGTVIALHYNFIKGAETEHRMELFEAATGERILSLDFEAYQDPDSHFLPDGRTWAYADGSKIKFWDLQSRNKSHSLDCNATVVRFSVSPDGMLLAAGQSDDLISTWNLTSGDRVGTFAGHQGALTTLAFSPDGRTLASGSTDGTIKLWHLATRREMASFTQQEGVFWLTFSPDNRTLVSGGMNAYQVWRAPRGDAAMPPTAPKSALSDLPTNSVGRVLDGAARLTPRMVAEEELCLTNLVKLHAAIMAYRKDHHQMPDWLGDLVPAYLNDTNCLICPVHARTGLKPDLQGMDDLRAASSYYYEFTAQTNTLIDPYGGAPPSDTIKAWMEKQLDRYGSIVPVVRCRMHPHFLSVTFAGEQRRDSDQEEWSAEQDRQRIARAKDSIKQWLVLAPIPLRAGQSGAEALGIEQIEGEGRLKPKAGEPRSIGGAELKWRQLVVQDYVIDFNAFLEHETPRSVAYAVCYIRSDIEQHGLQLLVGSDDEARVYLNGKQVYKSLAVRAFFAEEDTAQDISLNAGLNVLVFKVVNETQEPLDNGGKPGGCPPYAQIARTYSGYPAGIGGAD